MIPQDAHINQSSCPVGYTYQFSDPVGCTYQSNDLVGYIYQSSDFEGYTYQYSDPKGYITCGDPIGHCACKVHYPIDKANSYPSVDPKQSMKVTSKRYLSN